MKFPLWITLIAAVGAALVVFALGSAGLRPALPLVAEARFELETITPNADGVDDITTFRYTLTRGALVSIRFVGADGRTYSFREQQPRIAGDYQVPFSGVVDGFVVPGEAIANRVERRLLPNGAYRWVLEATGDDGEAQVVEGVLNISEADSPLPLISSFSVGPQVFTPNQDGIDDRVEILVYLEQPADLRVFLRDDAGREIPVSARKEGRKPGEAGRHVFDYEGGVDLGSDPPPDGTYAVLAVAQDAEGQRVVAEASLTIQNGGKPMAEIAPQSVGVDVVFTTMPYNPVYFSSLDRLGERIAPPADPADLSRNAITMPLGHMLVFRLTVENYNDVPIRTTYPPPGTVYDQTQMAASLGAYDSPGAWRVGIQCETSTVSFPYRWALGDESTLMAIPDPKDGTLHYYVPPRTQVVVWGAVRMTRMEKRQNPQTCWAGLIQEDVEVSLRNSYVGARDIELVDPNAIQGEGG
jgi:hypothetical protein